MRKSLFAIVSKLKLGPFQAIMAEFELLAFVELPEQVQEIVRQKPHLQLGLVGLKAMATRLSRLFCVTAAPLIDLADSIDVGCGQFGQH